MGIELGHEAHRDGLTGTKDEQFVETVNAVVGHTAMAMRMQNDPKYKDMMDNLIVNDGGLVDDMLALQSGDMIGHVLENYDTSADYWKMMEDGSLEFDGDGWLKDSNGNQIYNDNGEPVGAAGVQGGLQNILGIDNAQAVAMLKDIDMEFNEGRWLPTKDGVSSIGLDNDIYKGIYEDGLYEHNTEYIYNNMTGDKPATYGEYQANNFIINPEGIIISLQKPLDSESTSDFGLRTQPITGEEGSFHGGTDFRAQNPTDFNPFAAGIVASINSGDTFGENIILEHPQTYNYKGKDITTTYNSLYGHMSEKEGGGAVTNFMVGDAVSKDDFLGKTGGTGAVTAPHLHAEVYYTSLKDNPFGNWLDMQGDISFAYDKYFINHNDYYNKENPIFEASNSMQWTGNNNTSREMTFLEELSFFMENADKMIFGYMMENMNW